MGNIASRVINTVTRPIREYNLHERAHKAVLRNKYVPSPRHPSTENLIQKSIQAMPPAVKEKLALEDEGLDTRLQKVFVTSDVTPKQPLQSSPNKSRALPLNRVPPPPAVFGYHDPKVIPYGKATLANVLAFITDHAADPKVHTAQHIAKAYKLDVVVTEQVLKYFCTFRMIRNDDTNAAELDDVKMELFDYSELQPSSLPEGSIHREVHEVTMLNVGEKLDEVRVSLAENQVEENKSAKGESVSDDKQSGKTTKKEQEAPTMWNVGERLDNIDSTLPNNGSKAVINERELNNQTNGTTPAENTGYVDIHARSTRRKSRAFLDEMNTDQNNVQKK